jgi:prepilin-type processing-associated H-X9-DG protein
MPGYPQYKTLGSILRPPPSAAITLVDESVNTIDDGYFAVNSGSPNSWQNSPTVRHGQAGAFAFADGHAEQWHWRKLHLEQTWSVGTIYGGVDTTTDLRRLQAVVFLP